MSDTPDLTVGILKQIRDDVSDTKAQVATLNQRVSYLHRELENLDLKVENGFGDLREDITQLKTDVRHCVRAVDATLQISLEDTGRMDSLETRLRSAEAKIAELQRRRGTKPGEG